MMKKGLILSLIFAFAISFVSCDKNISKDEQQNVKVTIEKNSSLKDNIGDIPGRPTVFQGKCEFDDNTPVNNAMVSLSSLNSNKSYSTTTNINGEFEINDVISDTYNFKVKVLEVVKIDETVEL